MKTKELIRQLQKADPTGEEDCVINGHTDILSVHPEPAYYDGPCEVLIRNPECPYYNVISAKITGRGTKISIDIHSIEDALLDHPELPVDLSELGPERQVRWGKWLEERRAEVRQIHLDVDASFRESMEKWFADYTESREIDTLKHRFEGYINNMNRRKDVLKFLEEKAVDDIQVQEFLDRVKATWDEIPWWDEWKHKKPASP